MNEDDDNKDEDEVKDNKDDNKKAEEDDKEEDEDNYQTIKCFTFSESQTQAELTYLVGKLPLCRFKAKKMTYLVDYLQEMLISGFWWLFLLPELSI